MFCRIYSDISLSQQEAAGSAIGPITTIDYRMQLLTAQFRKKYAEMDSHGGPDGLLLLLMQSRAVAPMNCQPHPIKNSTPK